jgi:hypothetical protein
MSFAWWVYARQRDGKFRKLSRKHYDTLYSGDAPFEDEPDGEALIAEFAVELEGRKPTRIASRCFRRIHLDKTGVRDPQAAQDEASLSLELGEVAQKEGRPIGELASARGVLLQRRLETRFRWQPTPADLEELAEGVNRRAKRHLIGPPRFRLLK